MYIKFTHNLLTIHFIYSSNNLLSKHKYTNLIHHFNYLAEHFTIYQCTRLFYLTLPNHTTLLPNYMVRCTCHLIPAFVDSCNHNAVNASWKTRVWPKLIEM